MILDVCVAWEYKTSGGANTVSCHHSEQQRCVCLQTSVTDTFQAETQTHQLELAWQ